MLFHKKVEFLAFFLLAVWDRSNGVPCTSQDTCGSCLSIPDCTWCKTKLEAYGTAIRCDLERNLLEKECPKADIVKHENRFEVVDDVKLSDAGALMGHAVQVRPQRVKLSLRPNQPQKLKLTFRQAEDYPVDLYYLMDLTANMRDHKEKLAKLGDRLAASLINITKNYRMGFGSFVDKVVMPYASMVPSKLINPCSEESACRSPYGYQNHMALDKNVSRFVQEVESAQFSGNLDDAEGGLDAIMQAILCKDHIKWDTRSRKMILFATGSTFHVAGDGKLGGIVKANDGQCHMNDAGYYTETTSQDYPSLGQIARAIKKHKVSIIFAVPGKQLHVYERMSEILQGSSTGKLAEDSSNIVQLIADQYNKISSEVRLITNTPKGVNVKYRSKCLGDKIVETDRCIGLKVGTTIEFEVELELKNCPDRSEWKKEVSIHPFGLQDSLKIDLELQCECDCESPAKREMKSEQCSKNGTLECGICQCHKSFYGRECECSGSEEKQFKNIDFCQKTNTSKVCSGRGSCQCGICKCVQSEDKVVSGEFCECDNYSCSRDAEGRICGGSDRGFCGCNSKCECKNGWSGKVCDCGSPEMCIDPGDPSKSACNGQGTCQCGSCSCDHSDSKRYSGQYCQTLVQSCGLYEDCVACQVHNEGDLTEEECANCSFVPTVEKTVSVASKDEVNCQIEDDDNCVFIFVFRYDEETKQVHIKAQKEKVCRGKIDMMYVAIGVSVGVFVIGLLIIFIVRLCMYLKDKREYEAHLKQVADTDWTKATQNPLHVPPKTEYKNPIFGTKIG